MHELTRRWKPPSIVDSDTTPLTLLPGDFNFSQEISESNIQTRMIDHCGVSASGDQFDEVVAFYIAALAPLNYVKMFEYPGHAVGLGDGKADFWIGKAKDDTQAGRQHIAFCAKGSYDILDKPYTGT